MKTLNLCQLILQLHDHRAHEILEKQDGARLYKDLYASLQKKQKKKNQTLTYAPWQVIVHFSALERLI